VSDDLSRRLRVFEKATDPARYRLLRRAADIGCVRSKEAASIAGLDPTTGTAGYHFQELITAGLVVRTGPGEYRLTPDGARVEQALSTFLEGVAAPVRTQQVMLVAFVDEPVRARLDEILPTGEALLAVLQKRLAAGDFKPAGMLEVVRTPAGDDEESIPR
jgi:hypothetical protein